MQLVKTLVSGRLYYLAGVEAELRHDDCCDFPVININFAFIKKRRIYN